MYNTSQMYTTLSRFCSAILSCCILVPNLSQPFLSNTCSSLWSLYIATACLSMMQFSDCRHQPHGIGSPVLQLQSCRVSVSTGLCVRCVFWEYRVVLCCIELYCVAKVRTWQACAHCSCPPCSQALSASGEKPCSACLSSFCSSFMAPKQQMTRGCSECCSLAAASAYKACTCCRLQQSTSSVPTTLLVTPHGL